MSTIPKPILPILYGFLIAVVVGIVYYFTLFNQCDGCCDTCEIELADANARLAKAYEISTEPHWEEIQSAPAEVLKNRFKTSILANVSPFEGMNIHKQHLDQLVNYHVKLRASNTMYAGFRIYNGLVPSTGGNPNADIRQLIVPLSADGKVLPNSIIFLFDPVDRFELPCPTLCDMTSGTGGTDGTGGIDG